uniref:Uncharacterized protein n=1 Tax=Heligmosomoides polygyrus TaxID=6339 RepID=A0A183GHW3_HELPZ
LLSAIQQVVWKSGGSHNCFSNILRDCLIFQFSHFNVTLVFDYIVIVMMIFILLSVCLLFFGILTDTSCLLLPHILIQGIFLLFSIGNFILYAVSYFYGDLYTHSKSFEVKRMWLATLLIALAMFQTYLFSAVIQCSLYITRIEENLRRRASEFERCSERVRLAKENGLWRTTSWGGGFQQYKGQFDEKKPKKSNKQRGFHVQWSAQTPEVEAVDETAGGSSSPTDDVYRPEEPTTSGQTPSERRTSSVDDATQTISTHRPKLVHQPRSLTDSSRKVHFQIFCVAKITSNFDRVLAHRSGPKKGRSPFANRPDGQVLLCRIVGFLLAPKITVEELFNTSEKEAAPIKKVSITTTMV